MPSPSRHAANTSDGEQAREALSPHDNSALYTEALINIGQKPAVVEEEPKVEEGLCFDAPCARFRYQVHPDMKIGIVVLDRKRPWPSCPNPETDNEWSADMLAKVKETLTSVAANQPGKVTVYDTAAEVRVNDDKTIRHAVKLCQHVGVDVLVAVQPTISDGRLAPVLAQQWQHSCVFWATPEEQTGEMISGNSLVGTHMYCASLRQLGFACHLVYGNMDWTAAETQLVRSANISFATRFIQQTKVGLIGHQAPGFTDLQPDRFLMNKTFGSLLQNVSIEEFMDTAATFTELEVADDVTKVLQLGLPLNGVDTSELPLGSRAYLAMKKIVDDNNFDCLAVQCWPQLPAKYGQWPNAALARLATEGLPIANEGDVDGAVGSLVAKLLGCGAIYLSNLLEFDNGDDPKEPKPTVTIWNGGIAPFQLSEVAGSPEGPSISRHFNNKKAGCLDATIKEMEVTIFRFWIFNGKYHFVVFEGKTVAPKRHLLGNNGLVEISSVPDIISSFDKWIQLGFPHHVCVVEGHRADRLLAFARHFSVTVVN